MPKIIFFTTTVWYTHSLLWYSTQLLPFKWDQSAYMTQRATRKYATHLHYTFNTYRSHFLVQNHWQIGELQLSFTSVDTKNPFWTLGNRQ